ncbi:MAG: hypothetical protein V9F05_11925 [Chitinophagaceae bacterium]
MQLLNLAIINVPLIGGPAIMENMVVLCVFVILFIAILIIYYYFRNTNELDAAADQRILREKVREKTRRARMGKGTRRSIPKKQKNNFWPI